ncbi:M15 family metallopeptidase [Yoonia sp.]|uniref:M15 family metallopeptidase n=1 Tax=Yoonia sp. TaxID=2212373 RepID=UPI002E0C8FE3|nr:M15 family metallopeptidase [Yoonia sp.]
MITRKYSKRSLTNLRGIHPDLRRVIDRALQESPLDFIVIEGLRTEDRQRQLVQSGASRTMNSRHLTGHAVDLLPIGPDGKAAFDWPLYHKLGPAVEAAATKEGVALTWGGRWTKFRDGPHFELKRDVYPPSDWTTGDKPPKAPARPDDKESKAPEVAAGGAGAVALALDVAPAASGVLGQLSDIAQIVAIVAVVGLVGYMLWRRK